ncbi:hypothetical protein [Bradyrhizobium sp. AZCC 2262]|uniref:hypothetical protein n=1 Tax=Bradyrhizobium sp. AZCC 2262 TaxID=3117022 RepID=UPI002FEEB1B2
MSGGWLGRTAILLLMVLVTVMPATADSPGSELERLPDADDTFTSPDGQIRVEQYSKKKGEYDLAYQFWTFDEKHQHGALLNRAVSVPADRRSIFNGDAEALGRHGLGLFLQPAGVQEDAPEIQGSRFAQSPAGTSGPGDGR